MMARIDFHPVAAVFRRSTFTLARLSPIGRWQKNADSPPFVGPVVSADWCHGCGALLMCWRDRKQTKLAAVTFCLPHRLIWGLKSDLHCENSAYDLLLLWQLPNSFTDDILPGYFTLWPIYTGCIVSYSSSRQLSQHVPAHVEFPCDKAAVVADMIELTPVLHHVIGLYINVPWDGTWLVARRNFPLHSLRWITAVKRVSHWTLLCGRSIQSTSLFPFLHGPF
jgi:hypothetical protein